MGYLIIGSDSITNLIVKHSSLNDLILPVAFKPSSITPLRNQLFLVTYNSTTYNQRHVFNASLIETSTTPIVHIKPTSSNRDMASTYIEVPISNFNVALYLVLTGENKIEKVNADSGAYLGIYTIAGWTSTNVTKEGFVKEMQFSNFVIAAREDEDKLCIVNYVTSGSGNRCFNTGMNDVSALSIS